MILLFFLMVLFCCCGLIIGTTFLSGLDPWQHFNRKGDRIIISIWTGLLILADYLLLISLFSPLSGRVSTAATLCLLLVAFLHQQTRNILKQVFSSPDPRILRGTTFLMLGIAAYCSQAIVWYDSGLYHIQKIKWLSQFGTVPGLALIQSRFGFISSWFTLPAVVNYGPLSGRVASLAGAICLLLLLGHGLVAFLYIVRGDGRRQDLFIAATTLLVTPVILLWGMPNSPTPDFPVIVVTIIAAWALFVIADIEKSNREASAINVTLLPLILAGGAVTLKFSAFPLIPIAAIFYLFNSGFTAGTAAVSLGTVMFFLAPIAIKGIMISGCAFYPASFSCVDLPWSLGAATAETETKIIQDWARWGERFAPADAAPWDWILPWFKNEKLATALMVLSLLAIIFFIASRGKKRLRQNLYIMALAITGIVFMFTGAPTWRFGLGYLVLLPSLLVASQDNLCLAITEKFKRIKIVHNFAFIGLIIAVFIALHVHILQRPSYRLLDEAIEDKIVLSSDHPHFNFLYPPRIWNIGYQKDLSAGMTVAFKNTIIQDHAENFMYYRPEDSKVCWDAPLPCAPAKLKNIQLRDEESGLEGGFEKTDNVKRTNNN